jgi:two-component system sensor histidine kinase DesK
VWIQLLLLIGAWWLGSPWGVLVLILGVCSSAGFGSLSGRINSIKNAAQRLSQEEVRRLAATAERERIGRDLHDLLGHTLSLITLKLELSRKLFDRDHETALRELTDAENVARKALAEVRSAVTGMRATDLAAELASAHLLLESSGVNMLYEPPDGNVPSAVEPVLAMIVREAVTNIARHAKATRTRIRIEREGKTLKLFIADDGRGGVHEFGNGLEGMRERVAALGGTLEIDSPRGKGTTFCVSVPVDAHADTQASDVPESRQESDAFTAASSLIEDRA